MMKTLLVLLLCCPSPARSAPEHLVEKARMEAFYSPYNLAVTAQLEGRLGDACALFANAVEGARKLNIYGWQEFRALLSLGSAYHARRDLKRAEKYYLEGMHYFKMANQELGTTGLSGLGRIYLDRGLPEKAAPLLKEARDIEFKESGKKGDLTAVAAAMSDLARLDELQGDRKKAEFRYLMALKMLGPENRPAFPAGLDAEQMDCYPIILYRLGELNRRGGDAAAARARFEKALEAFSLWSGAEARPALKARKLEYRSHTLRALGRAAEAAADQKESARLYKQVSAVRTAQGE